MAGQQGLLYIRRTHLNYWLAVDVHNLIQSLNREGEKNMEPEHNIAVYLQVLSGMVEGVIPKWVP